MGELGRRTPSGALEELEAITASPRGAASLDMAGDAEPAREGSPLGGSNVLFAVAPVEVQADGADASADTEHAEGSAADEGGGATQRSATSSLRREDTQARKKNKRMTVSAIIAGSFINDEVGDTSSDEEKDPEEEEAKIGMEMLILPVIHFFWYSTILVVSAHLLNLWLKIFQGASGVEERLEHLVSKIARPPSA
jgi:hypothetical protein